MLPDGVLSSQPIVADFLPPRNAVPRPLVDYELGGIALSDPSQGLMVKPWRMQWIDGQFIIDALAVAPTVVLSRAAVTEFSFTFDQNMKPFITFVDGTGAYYYWYDGTVSDYRLVALPSGVITPKCSLDDKRSHQANISDIILAYMKGRGLYYRQQRDRFGIERLLNADAGVALRRVGMNNVWRFQFDVST
jgi:hypothetical protein